MQLSPRWINSVAVTGMGLVTPLGGTVNDTWKCLLDGKSGIKSWNNNVNISSENNGYFDVPCKVAGYIDKNVFDPIKFISKNPRAQSPRFIAFALAASKEALLDANWPPQKDFDPSRTGVSIGSGIGSTEEFIDSVPYIKQDKANGYKKISPYFVPRLLVNMASGHVSIENNFQGPNISISTACATGAHSIGEAARLIMHGDADVMVCGGTESTINSLCLAGFARAKALSTKFNDSPEKSSRPFDSQRDGFVMVSYYCCYFIYIYK